MIIGIAFVKAIICILLIPKLAVSQILRGRLRPPPPPPDEEAASVSQNIAYFDQYIDHANPSLGTFKQRYYWDDTNYKGPGSPIVLVQLGEEPFNPRFDPAYVRRKAIPARFARALGAGALILEHRYYGESSPYPSLTTKNLQYLTLNNVIADHIRFARNVKLPFVKNSSSNAQDVPWIISGTSYAGAMVGWLEALSPGTFWAYHASSAVVQSIENLWEYFQITVDGPMPKDCAENIESVIQFVDDILTHGNETEQAELKSFFHLGSLKYHDDFAYAISNPVFWQFGPNYIFCRRLNRGHITKTDPSFLPKDSRIRRAITAYAAEGQAIAGSCPSVKGEKDKLYCYKTHDPSNIMFTRTDLNTPWNRQYIWMACNQPYEWWQDTKPPGTGPRIVSKFLTAELFFRICRYSFPTTKDGLTYGINAGKTPQQLNAYTGGWNRGPSKRLMWANFQYDPYRSATISSPFRPGGPQKSTAEQPIFIGSHGYHAEDYTYYGLNKSTIRWASLVKLWAKEVEQMKTWVAEYPTPYNASSREL